ncbi:excalibur calcium-binding domain-containing protein [Arthrobacter globiformis]|uniref:excalibur calcium-binding domain-containing protein n=1 Tax=Arthrobacter globiformis TaxID=1665 RepID=UPI000B4234ED|nr:excalibur calcium-binding domain-containing protein [Arthrobacter globiformis]
MKKSVSALAVAAVVGLSTLAATPANATTTGAFPNCSAAAAAGVYNIPLGAPGYGPHLDRDKDGIGCENSAAGSGTTNVAPAPVVDNQVPAQVAQMPVGGVATGAAQETHDNSGLLALGGLAAAAVAGSLIVRRRASVRA